MELAANCSGVSTHIVGAGPPNDGGELLGSGNGNSTAQHAGVDLFCAYIKLYVSLFKPFFQRVFD